MSCHDHDDAILDMARGAALSPGTEGAALAHLECCAACAAKLEREKAITKNLRALAAATPGPADPDAMERRLVAELSAMAAPATGTRPSRGARWPAWLAAAAALVIGIGLAFGWRAREAPPAPAPPAVATTEFVPWPGASALPAFESGQLVRTELPASVLPLLGLDAPDTPPDANVAADVIYGQDGLARAVRLVTESME